MEVVRNPITDKIENLLTSVSLVSKLRAKPNRLNIMLSYSGTFISFRTNFYLLTLVYLFCTFFKSC